MTAPHDPIERLRAALADQYDIERLLGQGGMGAVYLARDKTLDRHVAIKVVAAEVASSPVLRERFLQEARVVARLRHPGIVTVYSAGDAGGQLYFAMEFVRGESLRELIQREGKVAPERATEILREMAMALDYAHSHGVIHRDVKPENVLIDQDSGRAMLTDFGVARALERDGSLTGTGVVLGSPRYMSPEQATGETTLDGRADLYSLGLVGYEMIMGRPVVDGATAASMLVKHLTETPVSLSEAAPDVPPNYSAAVDRALVKAPEQRWSTGREMAQALGGVVTTPTPTPLALPALRRDRTRRMAMVAGGVAVAALAAFFALRNRNSAPRQTFVVVPFEVQSGNDNVQWLREGAVNMLTLSLSQWTDLTVTDYERTLDFVQGEGASDERVSLEAARRIARRANAGSLVMGQVSTTPDSLVVTARLYEAGSGKLLNSDTRATGIDTDPRPTFDALARYLLDVSGGTAATTVDLARATTSSVQAYREYIEGLRALNSWNLDRADSLFASATARDSTFALAFHKRALTRGWSDAGGTLGPALAQRAMSLAGRLPPRERALVEGHLFLSRGLAVLQTDTAGRRDLREAVRVYAALVATDSLSAEAWYGLGDAKNHLANSGVAEGFAELTNGSMAAFRRALQIDPDFHLAYSHLIDMYRAWGATGNNDILRGDSIVPVASVPVAQRQALRDSAKARAVAAASAWLAADATVPQPYRSLALSLRFAGRSDSAVKVLRTGASRTGAAGTALLMEVAYDEYITGSGKVHGVVDTALSQMTPENLARRTRNERNNFLAFAMSLGPASGDSKLIDKAAEFWNATDSLYLGTNLTSEPHLNWVTSVMRAAMGATLTPELRRTLIEGARTTDRATGPRADGFRNSSAPLAYLVFLATRDSSVGAMAQRWAFNNRMIELDAARALVDGDTARARTIAREFPTPDSLRTTNFGMAGLRTMARAEVLAQLGDLRTAVGNYEALDPTRFTFNTPNEPGLTLYIRSFAARARLYEQIGEPDKARTAYERFLALWPVDDPITARERSEARAALARLRDAPRPR
jgi:tetratricopeptide (TPR) repeat protein/TolB-like protein/predicted Ser/Thr protein kinase